MSHKRSSFTAGEFVFVHLIKEDNKAYVPVNWKGTLIFLLLDLRNRKNMLQSTQFAIEEDPLKANTEAMGSYDQLLEDERDP